MSAPRPVVYCESTLGAREVLNVLPTAVVRPSIARGDLYRDRALGYQLFLIIDGVFMQRQAVSPREVMDVMADGAEVAGASSMGALRAAECWPGGMRGVGSIYRLFRRGALESDDEVIVMFSPLDGQPLTQALVNVRYAANRAVCLGLMRRQEGRRLVEAAGGLYFADRSWSNILAAASLASASEALDSALSGFDLKKSDARRALKRVRGWLQTPGCLSLRPARDLSGLLPSEMEREPTLKLPDTAEQRKAAQRWQLISEAGEPQPGSEAFHRLVCMGKEVSPEAPTGASGNDQLMLAWLKLRASDAALAWANTTGKTTVNEALLQAGQHRLANVHGFERWSGLMEAAARPCCQSQLEQCAKQLVILEHVRDCWLPSS